MKTSATFGNSGNTLFTVGNGSSSNPHNALQVMQSGDIYISNTSASGQYYNKPMIRLQESLDSFETIEGASNKYYTKTETDNKIKTATNDMATQTWVKSQNYLTEHQDLSEYAKSADVTSEIDSKIGNLNISQYETIEGAKSKYQPKGNYLTEHQDLSSYAKKTEVTSDIKAAIDGLVNGASTTMDTLKELEDAITGNKSIIDTLNSAITQKADKSEISDMATQTWVKSQKYLTEHQDLSEYAKSADVAKSIGDLNISQYETIEGAKSKYQPKGNYLTEHQDLSEYAKSVDVTKAIGDLNLSQYETITGAAGKYQPKGNYLTEHQSLGNYYTKGEVDNKISNELSGYETVTGAAGKYQPKGNYLTEHQSLGNYYLKSEVDELISKLMDKIDSLGGGTGGVTPSGQGQLPMIWYTTEHGNGYAAVNYSGFEDYKDYVSEFVNTSIPSDYYDAVLGCFVRTFNCKMVDLTEIPANFGFFGYDNYQYSVETLKLVNFGEKTKIGEGFFNHDYGCKSVDVSSILNVKTIGNNFLSSYEKMTSLSLF